MYTRGGPPRTRIAGLAIAAEGGGDSDPSRGAFTLYELRKDGARNECDYSVYLDERYRAQPYVMEKVPCVADGDGMQILGRRYVVHVADAPRYRPDVILDPPNSRG